MNQITDEMPDTWVRAIADAIEAAGHEVHDAHESGIAITLTDDTRAALAGTHDDHYIVIGWDGQGVHWGLSADAVTVPVLDALGGRTPDEIAARALHGLRTGWPEPRPLRHAVPYAAASDACVCPLAFPCRGIVPDADCPDHGNRANPAMAWHWEANCA